jgi:hypothetical protein
MDVVYNYNVAKAAVAATLFYANANFSTLGIETNTENSEFKVFQVATNDSLYFSLGSVKVDNITVSLIDLNGKLILTKMLINNVPTHTISLDSVSKGMYLFKVEAEGKTLTKKIVLQ